MKITRTMNDSGSKHKVAFYFVLVFLLATLRHCHGSKDEAISHSARALSPLPKSIVEITSLRELRRSYDAKSTAEKLTEIRGLLRSLLFDWSLDGESEIAGRTFGRMRMMKMLGPVAFLAGFLTAVILGIKIIGVINMLLITGVLVLNLAVILGKLFFAKLDKLGHHHHPHHHHHPPPYYGSNAYANSYIDRDDSLPYRSRNFNSPSFPNFNQPAFPNQIPQGFGQPAFPNQIPQGFGPLQQQQPQPTLQNFNQPAFPSQSPQGFGQAVSPSLNSPAFPGQIPPSFSPLQQQQQQPQPTLQNFNQPSITPQQPPTSFLPQQQQQQPQNSLGGIQMQTPQQVPTAPTAESQFEQQPFNQAKMTNQFSGPSAADTSPNNGIQLLSTTPATEIEMINLQEVPQATTMSPLDILNDVLSRMGEKKLAGQVPLSQARFKRKSGATARQRRQRSLSKPFS